MPNRIIKESIKRSPQIDTLTWFEEVVFVRLIVTCDDYGCTDARSIVLKNDLFPTKETVSKKSVEDAIHKLNDLGLVRIYEFDGIPYLFMPSWEKHQRIRNKRRKYPEPPNDIQPTAICGQLSADCGQSSADCMPESNPNPIQNPIQNPNPNSIPSESLARFDEFWDEYPRKIGKQAAAKAWQRIKVSADLHKVIIEAIRAQKRSNQWQKNGGQFIPNPATWLNQGRWDDEVVKPTHDNFIRKPTNNPFYDDLKERGVLNDAKTADG